MTEPTRRLNRREFTQATLLAGSALATGAWATRSAEPLSRRVRTGVIGCGSVSNSYLHVLEIITAAREAQATGRRVALRSTFRWPVVA